MSIRTKILFIILVTSVPPLLFLLVSGVNSLNALGQHVQTRAGNLLINSQSQSLQRIAEDHANFLRKEHQLVDATLKALTMKTANVLEARGLAAKVRPPSKKQPPQQHEMSNIGNEFCLYSPSPQFEEFFSDISQVMREYSRKYPKLILWQRVRLVDNSQLFYPTSRNLDVALNCRIDSTVLVPGKKTHPVWSRIMDDIIFKTSMFTVSQDIILGNGKVAGTATIAVSANIVMPAPGHLLPVSKNIASYLVQIDTQNRTLPIFVQRSLSEKEKMWFSVPDAVLNVSQEVVSQISRAALAGKSGSLVTNINGTQYLIAFAPLGVSESSNSTLLITIPSADITKAASKEKDAIRSVVARKLDLSMSLLGATLFLVCIAAVIFSHSLSKNIHKLVDCVRQIGTGDFSIRIPDVGHDEIGELGTALNEMIPALEENVHLKSSLQLASEVQRNLFPKETPQPFSYDIAGASYYCAETGGDYFDFLSCVPGSASRIHMAVGDVVGHGVPAALLMATARAYLRSCSKFDFSLAQITYEANELVVCDTYGTGQFMTLFLASLDTLSGAFTWTRAGHDAAIVYRDNKGCCEYLLGDGATALGVVSKTYYKENSTTLESGDILLIATDGVWECMSPQGDMFGKQRIEKIIYENRNLSSSELIEKLYSEALKFSEQSSLEDDFTCIMIKNKKSSSG